MKLPRYSVAKSVPGELASARASMITPAEAAREKVVIAGAISSIADTISETIGAVSEIKAEEEYSSGVAQWYSSMGAIDSALENKPYEKDESGRVVVDEENIVNQEQDARKKISGDIRKTLKSGIARKRYDQFLLDEGIKRTQAYQAQAIERDRNIMLARLDEDVADLLIIEDYEGATSRLEDGFVNGALSPTQYTQDVRMVRTRELTDSVYKLLKGDIETVDVADINAMLERMDDPEFDLLDDKQILTFQNQLLNRAEKIEGGAGSDQRDIYLSLLTEAHRRNENGEPTMDLATLIGSGLKDRGYFNHIYGMIAKGGDVGGVSNEAVKIGFQDAISNLKRGAIPGEWKENIEELRALVQDPTNGLTYEDRNKLEKDIEDMATGIFSHPTYQNLSRQSYESVVGFTEDMVKTMTAKLQSQYKTTGYVAREFQQALIRKAETLPVSRVHELDAWVEEAKRGFRLQANQANLKKIGVAVTFPDDGILTEELRLEISTQIATWYKEQIKTGDMQSINNKIESTINEIERLNDWTLDSPVSR